MRTSLETEEDVPDIDVTGTGGALAAPLAAAIYINYPVDKQETKIHILRDGRDERDERGEYERNEGGRGGAGPAATREAADPATAGAVLAAAP